MSNRLRPSLRLSARLRRLRALRARGSQTRASVAAQRGGTSEGRPSVRPVSRPRRLHPLLSVSRLGHLPLPKTRRGRILWLLSPLVLVGLTAVVVWNVAKPKVDVERTVRNYALPELRKVLGMPVEIGSIDSDYLSRVVLHDVVIGRDPKDRKTPFGANLRAKRVTLSLDFLGLVRGEDALQALRSVTIEEPSAWFERDAKGKSNWDSLLKKPAGPTKTSWAGRVIIRGGRLAARDETVRNSKGEPLEGEASAVDGTLDIAPEATAFWVNAPHASVGVAKAAIDGIGLTGRAFLGDAKQKPWVSSEVRWKNAPLPVLAGYAFPKGDVTLGAGSADGALLLGYDGAKVNRAPVSPWQASGKLDLRGVAGEAKALRAPNGSGVPFTALSGPLEFTGTAGRSTGLTLEALGSPLRVSGTAALTEGRAAVTDRVDFDAVVESRALNTTRLLAAVGPLVPRGLAVQVGAARATVRLTGTPRAFTARGRALAPNAAVRSGGNSARLDAPDVTLAFDNRTRRVVGTLSAALVEGGGGPGSGRARGFTTNFAVTPPATPGKNGPTVVRARFAAAGWNGRVSGANAALAAGKNARGAVLWTEAAGMQTVALRINAGAATVNADRLGAVRGAAGRGALRELVVRATMAGGRMPVALDLTLDNWAGRGRYVGARGERARSGGLRGRTLRVVARSADAARATGWSGTATVGGVAANEIQLASLAPEAAQALREADASLPGVADVAVNFGPGRNGALVADGQAHLSRAVISGEDVRDVRVQGRLDGARWSLALTQARSAYGSLAGWARGGGNGAPTFALEVPRITVPEALVNKLLAPQGLAASGAATARLHVVPAGNGMSAVQTRFSMILPAGELRALPRRGRDGTAVLARLQNAMVRGDGVLSLNASVNSAARKAGTTALNAGGGWRFAGNAEFSAERVQVSGLENGGARVQVPEVLRGTGLRGVRLKVRGVLAPTDLAPGVRLVSANPAGALAGELGWTRAVLPLSMTGMQKNVKAGATPVMTLGEGRAMFARDAKGWRVPRFSSKVFGDGDAQGADAGRVRGWASLATDRANRGNVGGQLLVERLDAARLQTLVQNALGAKAQLAVRVRGSAFARVDVSGTMDDPRAMVDARLLNGAVETGGSALPLDSARVRVDVADGVTVRDAVLWSRGARVAVSGTAMPSIEAGSDLALKLTANADSVRLKDVAGFLTNAKSEVDGLASGQFTIRGTLARPRVDGNAALKLATTFGVMVDEATARVHYENTVDGPRFAIEDIEGRTDRTKLTGRFLADAPADQWRFALTSEGLDTARVVRAGQKAANLGSNVTLPLRGDLGVQVDVRGRFGEGYVLVPLEGGAQVRAEGLDWRGRDLGAFNLDATLDGQTLRIEDVSLRDPKNPESPMLVISGSTPLEPTEAGLDMHIQAQRARLDLVRSAMQETRRTLRENAGSVASPTSISVTNALDALLRGWDALPQKLDGEANVQADFSGSVAAPVADITANVREAKLGGQALPTLDAAVRVEDGAATVKTLELKQIEPAATPDDDPRETTLRFTPGGRITMDEVSLDGELLNANLSQLAPWVGSLRNGGGSALLQGEISLFNFQLRGTPVKPLMTGSLEAQNLEYRTYTLDRLRLARFEIQSDVLAVERGNLTVVKGGFQSSAPWGHLPWNWTRGVDMERPLDLHLPVERRDFGALAGAFLPAIKAADAEGFDGNIDIGGTFSQPLFSGGVQMVKAKFATDASTGIDIGVRELSGALRFGEDNTLQLDNLRGTLARADDVNATTTGNLPADERNPAKVKSETAKDSHFGGAFALNGTVALRLDPANFSSLGRFAAAQRYDVALNVSKGEFWSGDISGVRDLTLDAAWKTGTGAEETAQRVTWQFAAAGRDVKGGKTTSKGSAVGTARSAGTALMDLTDITKTRWNGTMALRGFAFDAMNAARGKLDGDLELVNMVPHRAAANAANFGSRGFSLASVEERLRLSRNARRIARDEGVFKNEFDSAATAGKARLAAKPTVQADAKASPALAQQSTGAPRAVTPPAPSAPVPAPAIPAPAEVPEAPLTGAEVPGIRGTLTLSETEITGAPVGTVGVARLLPAAPAFDIRILLDRAVRFVSPTLRAEFTGGVQVSGTPRDPSMVGTLIARDGTIRFPAASARITTAEVDINMANDAATGLVRTSANIDATARGQAGRYQITLHVRGPLDFGSDNAQQLTIDVTSNPPLSQDEAFARLTGTSIRDLQSSGASTSAENEAYASAFLSVLSAPLFSGIERSLEDALGLSNITLDYRLSEPLSVQFGKAVGDRVYVSYRRSITGNTPGAPTSFEFRVDYRIKGDFQLGLQTDERNRTQVTLEKTFRF